MGLAQNLLRIGIVSSVDYTAGMVRVTFPDRDDSVSDLLPVLTPGGWGKGNAIPSVGESVLCCFLGNGIGTGFCLGSYYTDSDLPPAGEQQRGVWFEDGSYVYYDRQTGKLVVKAASGVKIEGDLEVTGSITAQTITRAGEQL